MQLTKDNFHKLQIGDLVKIKETGELGIIVDLWMRGFILSAGVYCFSSKDETYSDLDDLELVK